MNGPLPRELAFLAAKLHLLRSQRHALSDLSDIKEFRHLEEFFQETLEQASRDGLSQIDPLAEIYSDWERLAEWNNHVMTLLKSADETLGYADKIHANPSEQSLRAIQTTMAAWPLALQEAIERLRDQIQEDDWAGHLPYPELTQVAAIMGWDETLKNANKDDIKLVCNDLEETNFAHGILPLVVSRYAVKEDSPLIQYRVNLFESLLQKTATLLDEHRTQDSILREVKALTVAGQFESARNLLNQLSPVKFVDLFYKDAEIPLQALESNLQKNVQDLSDVYEQLQKIGEESSKIHIIPPIHLFLRGTKTSKDAGNLILQSEKWVTIQPESEKSYAIVAWRNALMDSLGVFRNGTTTRLLRSIYILLTIWIIAFLMFSGCVIIVINKWESEAQAERAQAERIAEAKRVAEEKRISKHMIMMSLAGGTLPSSSNLAGEVVAAFQIGKLEVTWGEWQKVRDWAVANGYDLKDVGQGLSESHPVTHVNWYDVVKWCNAKSEKEGKTPVYQVSGTTYKTGEIVPTVSESANGYRLPSEKEWEWAARGGKNSKGYTYAGSNDLNAVGWFNGNSGGKTHEVGGKLANELEIYDMSGNVWEWCFDRAGTSHRRIRGGSWYDFDVLAAVAYRGNFNGPDNRYGIVGFRLARSSGN